MKKLLSQIKPSPINEEIYSTTDLSDLELSLRELGQLEPIVINSKGDIISGHRRYFSMTRLGWKEWSKNPRLWKWNYTLIQHNNHRTKTVTDINNEFRILEKEYKKRLGSQGSRVDLKKNKKGFRTVVEHPKPLVLELQNSNRLSPYITMNPTFWWRLIKVKHQYIKPITCSKNIYE